MRIINKIVYGVAVVFLSPLWIPLVFIMWFNTLIKKPNAEEDV